MIRNIKIRISFIAMLMLCVNLCGCNKSEDPEKFPEGTVPWNGESDRAYLEGTASELIGLLDANHQSTLNYALRRFVDYCKTYKFPDDFGEGTIAELTRSAEQMLYAVENSDYSSYSRAATDLAISLKNFHYLFQANPDLKEWQKLEATNCADFRYWINGKEFNLIMKGEDGEWRESVDVNGRTLTVSVPRTITLSLLEGQTTATTTQSQHLLATIKTDGKDNVSFTSNSNVRAANIEVATTITANNSSITQNATVYVHNVNTFYREQALYTRTTLNGKNLCSIAEWSKFGENETAEQFAAMLTSGDTFLKLRERIIIRSAVNNFSDFLHYAGREFTLADGNPKEQAEAAAKALTASEVTQMFYPDEENRVRGRLAWEAYRIADKVDGETWVARPMLTLMSENTKYDFYSYFLNGNFYKNVTEIRALINNYKSYWK